MISPVIAFQGGAACGSWTEVGWTQTLGGGTVQMELCDAAGTPIPGWTNSQAGDGAKSWNISTLNPATYPSIRVRANLSGPPNTAQVNSWYCRFITQGDATNYIWNGSVNGNWDNASNWCGGGGGWPNGYVNAQQNAALSKRARIVLGVGAVGHCPDVYTLKLRDFDALMTGALYVTHRNPDLCRIFVEGEELDCYETPKEAAEKIRYYLDHAKERERIGQAGQQKVIARDTWDARLGATFLQLGLMQS